MWKLVRAHQKKGHTVAIASSATLYQIEPLAAEYGIEHIVCTRARVRNGKLTGGLVGKPVWGEGKAAGVATFAQAHGVDLGLSFGYANGNEDIPFLRSLGHASAVQPNTIKSYLREMLNLDANKSVKALPVPLELLLTERAFPKDRTWGAMSKQLGWEDSTRVAPHRVADAGYWIMKDQPDSLARFIDTFMAERIAAKR